MTTAIVLPDGSAAMEWGLDEPVWVYAGGSRVETYGWRVTGRVEGNFFRLDPKNRAYCYRPEASRPLKGCSVTVRANQGFVSAHVVEEIAMNSDGSGPVLCILEWRG